MASRGICFSACCVLAMMFGAPVTGSLAAQEAFEPPQAYPADRYEAGWAKNPFTLKTAPVSLVKGSFATDLAIGTYYGASDNPTIVVVNTKTHERVPLKSGTPAPNGMTLQSYSIQPSRRETTAVVTLGGESAVLRIDDSFIRQSSGSPGGEGSPGKPGHGPNQPSDPTQNAAGSVPRMGLNAANPSMAGVPSSPVPQRNLSPPGAANAGPGVAAYVPTKTERRRLTMPPPRQPAPPR